MSIAIGVNKTAHALLDIKFVVKETKHKNTEELSKGLEPSSIKSDSDKKLALQSPE